MVRREIKTFELEYSSGRITVDAPFNAAAVLAAHGASALELGGGLTVSAELHADSVALSIKHIYVKIGRVTAPAELFVNGMRIGEVDGEHAQYLFNIADAVKEGENRLSLVFLGEPDASRVGIYSPIEIVRFNNAIIDKVKVAQKQEGNSVSVDICLDTVGNTENVRAVATLVSPSGRMYYAGLTKGRGKINVSEPLYWWPHGYGVQNLYKLTVNLYGDEDVEDSAEMRIGLRTVEPSVRTGGAVIAVNGLQVLSMGAVYNAEPDLASPDLLRRLDAFITSASMANYNTLVIKKDAVRPVDKFYELCDIHGIMVVEEIDSMSAGMRDSIGRISHHASVCLVDLVNPETAEECAAQIGEIAPMLATAVRATAPDYCSCPSLPSDKLMADAVPADEATPFSYSVEQFAGERCIRDMLVGISERYPYPSNLSDFGYLSHLVSADKIAEEIKAKRLAGGSVGRAVFSELGDYKPKASSSAMDSGAKWKALQYYSTRFFSPIVIYADSSDGVVRFSITSQRKIDFSGTIEYRIVDAKNITVYKNSEELEFDGFSASITLERDLREYINGHEREYYLEYLLRESSSVVSSGVLLFVPEKHFKLEEPHIRYEISGSDRRFTLTLSADCFVRGVELDFNGVDAFFTDNYFDLTTSSPIKLTVNVLSGIETAYHLTDVLRIRSVYDITR